MSLYKLSLLFLGGGLGSICRFMISYYIPVEAGRFSYPTFLTNIFSSLLLGVCFKYYNVQNSEPFLLFFIMIGFCGGMSTFSTFTSENFQLLQQSLFGLFAVYTLLSICICLLFFWLGFRFF
jgi:fluoride exporter